VAVKVVAYPLYYPVPENEVLEHLRAAQVQVPVFQTQAFVNVYIILNIERRRLGTREELGAAWLDLYLSGPQIRINLALCPGPHWTSNHNHILAPPTVNHIKDLLVFVRIGNYLDNTGAVSQVYEDEAAKVTAPGHPASNDNVGADILR